jgi:hypothetical protein
MKGEAYKRYYEAHRDTILERNREKSKEYRAKLKEMADTDPAFRESLRAKGRKEYKECKARRHESLVKEFLDVDCPPERKETYKGLFTAPILDLSSKAFMKLLNGVREDAKKPAS